jgi:hypothetical protein
MKISELKQGDGNVSIEAEVVSIEEPKKLNRNFFGFEINPEYYEETKKRLGEPTFEFPL